jgi:hypothetical protein
MGNLARPGYSATTDRMWSYMYATLLLLLLLAIHTADNLQVQYAPSQIRH